MWGSLTEERKSGFDTTHAPGERNSLGEEVEDSDNRNRERVKSNDNRSYVTWTCARSYATALLRRMGDGSARVLMKVVSSCDKRREGARSL